MKPYIYEEFLKPIFDITAVSQKISTGKPIKIFGFIPSKPEILNLFKPDDDGRNIFHYLAIKGKLGMFLGTFFGPLASIEMLQREEVNDEILRNAIQSVDKQGYSVLQLISQYEPTSIAKLKEYGIEFSTEFWRQFFINSRMEILEPEFKDKAEMFLREAILKGEKEIFIEYRGQLYPHLPFIAATVKELSDNTEIYPTALEIYTNIFQNCWHEVLSHTDNIQLNMQQILRLSQVVEMKLKEDITLNQWASLLGATSFKNNDEVKEYILGKCAENFLAGTLLQMKFEDVIVNPHAIASDQLEKLQTTIAPRLTDKSNYQIPTTSDTIIAHDQNSLDTNYAQNTTLENVNIRPNVNPPSNASTQLAKTPSVKQLANLIAKTIGTSSIYKEYLVQDLGNNNYNQLHSFMSIMSRDTSFFDKILGNIAEKTNSKAINGNDFLVEYIATLQPADFLATTHTKKHLSTYDLACVIKNAYLAKLLFNKGLELGVYRADAINTNIQAAMKYNASEIIKDLLQRSDLIIDWYYVILQAMKCCNDAAKLTIEHYVTHDKLSVIEDVRGREGEIEKNPKYHVLNKILFNLCILASYAYKEGVEENIHNASIKKLLVLSELTEKLLLSNKVYYAENNLLVGTKTLGLLKHLVRCINKIQENDETEPSIAAANKIINRMIDQYKALKLPIEAKDALAKLEFFIDNLESQSQRSKMTVESDVTHLSILSGIDDLDEVELHYMSTSGFNEISLAGIVE